MTTAQDRAKLAEFIHGAEWLELVWKDFDGKTKSSKLSRNDRDLIVDALTQELVP